MEIFYDNKKVEELFTDFSLMAKKKGASFARLTKKRYNALKAAETFTDYLKTGLGKPHPLKGNKSKLYSINITGNIRLLVEPIADDMSIASLEKCTKIIIKGAEDYHGEQTTTYIP